MGVPVGEAGGEFPALLRCINCDREFETDETMDNDCPKCGQPSSIIISDSFDPATWRGGDDD